MHRQIKKGTAINLENFRIQPMPSHPFHVEKNPPPLTHMQNLDTI